jgi:hypothetical protein
MTTEEKKYKEDQQKRMDFYMVGKKTPSGEMITKILSRGDEYVIYEIQTKTPSDSIKMQIDTIAETDQKPLERFNEVRVNFSKIKGLLYKVYDDSSLKVRIAHILSHALSGKTTEANTQFNDLIKEINTEYSNQFKHRLRYLITIIMITIGLISLSINIYYYKRYADMTQVRTLVYILTGGSIGGFLSVSRRLRKTVFEKDVNKYLYIIYGFERMFISMLGALIIYFAIESNLAFGIVNELNKPIYGLVLFAIVAGFSETLIPNLLIRLEKDEKSS